VIKAERDLPGTEGRKRGEGRGEGHGREMTQTMYAHVNKRIKKKKESQDKSGLAFSKDVHLVGNRVPGGVGTEQVSVFRLFCESLQV
jgi:hypothetical protein